MNSFPTQKKKKPQFDPGCSNMTAHCCRLHLQAVNAALQASPAVQRFTPCLELERSVGSLHAVLSGLPSTGLLRKAAHLSNVSGHAIHGCPQTLGFGAMLCVQQLLVASYTGASWPSDVVISLQLLYCTVKPACCGHTIQNIPLLVRSGKSNWIGLN